MSCYGNAMYKECHGPTTYTELYQTSDGAKARFRALLAYCGGRFPDPLDNDYAFYDKADTYLKTREASSPSIVGQPIDLEPHSGERELIDRNSICIYENEFALTSELNNSGYLVSGGLIVCKLLSIWDPISKKGLLAHIYKSSNVEESLFNMLDVFDGDITVSAATIIRGPLDMLDSEFIARDGEDGVYVPTSLDIARAVISRGIGGVFFTWSPSRAVVLDPKNGNLMDFPDYGDYAFSRNRLTTDPRCMEIRNSTSCEEESLKNSKIGHHIMRLNKPI